MTSTGATRLERIDPITFEVLRNAFESIVDEMGLMLERVAHSLVVSEGRDFSAAICDPDGRLVAEGKDDLPAHVGTLPHTVKAVIEWLGKDRLAESDIILMNDPFLGGTHAQDVRAIKPVYSEGELVAFVQNSAHWSDAGGPVPGSFHGEATSTYGEALYIPPIHLVRAGELDDEVMRFILRNVRVPEITQGDFFAQIAACDAGERGVLALIEKYGIQVIEQEMDELITYSEALLREEFSLIPDGTYSFDDAIDFDPAGDRVTPIADQGRITIEGDRATYDLSRSDGQATGAVNATRSMAQSAVVVATKAVFPHVPANEGIYNAIESSTRRAGSRTPSFPRRSAGRSRRRTRSPSSAYSGVTCRCGRNGRWRAPATSSISSWAATTRGPASGREFVMYMWKEGGRGRPGKKDNHTAVSLYASGTRNEPVEVQERVYPILTHRYEFVTDSAGAGRHRGGIGVTRDFSLTHGEAVLSVLGSRAVQPIWGWAGGRPALGSGLIYDWQGEGEVEIGVMRSGVVLAKDRVIRYWEGGGGGWEDPRTRPVEWVLDDVADGFVSIEAARELYGVALTLVDEDAVLYEVDEPETARLRVGDPA